jgi:hypothetical protein
MLFALKTRGDPLSARGEMTKPNSMQRGFAVPFHQPTGGFPGALDQERSHAWQRPHTF